MVMGDLVLLETEINPVMTQADRERSRDHRRAQSSAARQPGDLLHARRRARRSGEDRRPRSMTALAASKTPLDAAGCRRATAARDRSRHRAARSDHRRQGQANGGVYQFAVPRRDPVTEGGMQLTPPGPMGVATAINFQPTGGGKAAITGDFVLTGEEVNPVIKALRANGIEVTAIHSHMLDEQPRLFFMHFWANDDAIEARQGAARGARQDGEHK